MMNKLQLFIFLVCICMLAGCTEEEENSGIRLIEGTASGQTVFADETTTRWRHTFHGRRCLDSGGDGGIYQSGRKQCELGHSRQVQRQCGRRIYDNRICP